MHARTFLCRESLWEAFEEIAREQRAPIDDVLSEAMRAYARQRSYGGITGDEPTAGPAHDYEAENAADLARTAAVRQPMQRAAPGMVDGATGWPRSPTGQPPPPPSLARPPTGRALPPPARSQSSFPEPPARPAQRPFTQPLGQPLSAPPPRGGPRRFPSGPVPLRAPPPARAMPPQLRAEPYMPPANPYGSAPGGSAQGRVATALSLTYLNQTFDVTKERFILGRSKAQADLVLDDPNVSRQHAAIERVGETWVLADLGSTNGCYVEGQRVTRRQVANGDVIEITTHQVRCTLR